MLALRFANAIFEPIWDRRYIDNVQITIAESIGVEHRGTFYEQAGTIRDIVQNHAMQVLSLVTMEPPASFEANPVRDEKVKVLGSIERFHPFDVPLVGRARAVRRRHRRRRARGRLPRRGGRGTRLRHRDLHRDPLRHRQLALGRRAVLPARGQAARQAHHRGGVALQVGAAPGAAHHRDRLDRAEHAGAAHPARRRRAARVRGQSARQRFRGAHCRPRLLLP